MKILYPTGLVTAYYGRNPLQVNLRYGGYGIAPHADTVRSTYTVPAGRRAVVTSVFIKLMRITGAAAPGLVAAFMYITFGGGGCYTNLCEIFTNGVGDRDTVVNGGLTWLLPTNSVEIHTMDLSTGGTVEYREQVSIMEYDP